jgi:hypothetical protein
MSQTATLDSNATPDSPNGDHNRVADAARSAGDTAKSMAKQAMATATAAGTQQAAKVADAARQVGEASQAKLETAGRDGVALAAFWLKVMQDQTAENIEAMRSLAAAKTWEEKLAVQSSFFSGSLTRMQDVFARYMELNATMTGGLLASTDTAKQPA